MNPADLSLPAISPSLTTKTLSLSTSAPQKSGKAPVPRIDVEPIYTQLKGALGSSWQDYKAAINAFVLGNLNQAELTWVLQPLLSNAPTVITSANPTTSPVSLVQLHNQLVICLYANISRDQPPSEVAPWVVATDKPSTAKNAGTIGASDKAEERLKREIMALHARDRRRIKSLKPDTMLQQEGPLKDMQDYRYELTAISADVPTGDATKSSWDMETRRKYVQQLASETLEFPSTSDMQNRIEPICYDEGLITGAQGLPQICVDLMVEAAEAYIKTILGELQTHARSNGIGCIQTAKFKRQLRQEENEAEKGTLQRSSIGLLPVEMELQTKREPLDERSLRLAMETGDPLISRNKFLNAQIRLAQWPTYTDHSANITNGAHHESDEMDIDDTWQGSTIAEHDSLLNVLDDCLALA
ncbi:hypothetical protein AMS68_001070 [Peltaster fructicola]|uniref:Transcriptional coactivator HFI1/ADA1 n=1 Tax=Peltaster fructicola TaxID=286661 RepID=A0A6H0XLG2_9PEZI|nr:hypothetical protein AMS68_001070 [Peltaster fructicola]